MFENEEKEAYIENSIDAIAIDSLRIIMNQMKKCVCKIYKGELKGTGFFTRIPYKKKLLSVLITNNHILNENDISNGKTINISLNNEKIVKKIYIDSNRKRYTDENLDVTIIEIKEEKDDIKDFLDLNEQIVNESNSYIYQNKSIYILNYPHNAKEVLASFGLLLSITDNKIKHKCDTDYGSSGSPILLLKNNKVIGIHCGAINNFKFGTLLTNSIKEFQNMSKNILVIKKVNNEKDLIKNNDIVQKINLSNINSNNDKNEFIKQLIRFAFFKKELKYLNNLSEKYVVKGYLVKKNLIIKLKKLYNFKSIIESLENNKLLEDINYQNFEEKYNNISQFLKKNESNDDIIKKENKDLNFNNKEDNLKSNCIYNIQNLKFISDFEIIDQTFSDFLNNIFENNIKILKVNYAIIGKKILLMINYAQSIIYEIVSLLPTGKFTVEYLIEIIETDIINNINALNNCIFKIFSQNNIETLLSLTNPIKYFPNIIFNIYPVFIFNNFKENFLNLKKYLENQNNKLNKSNKKSYFKKFSINKNIKLDTIYNNNLFRHINSKLLLMKKFCITNLLNKTKLTSINLKKLKNIDINSDLDSNIKIKDKSFESQESLGQESFRAILPYFKYNSNNLKTINSKKIKSYDIESGFFSS